LPVVSAALLSDRKALNGEVTECNGVHNYLLTKGYM